MTVALPTAYPSHPHASEEARAVAQDGLILLTEVGSGVHGTALPGTDDRDEMGICIEAPEYVTGLRHFEQFERHTAWDRAGGVRERSGTGDLDVVVYGARKFCRLALDGNPSVVTLLFAPDGAVVHRTELGWELQRRASCFISLRALDRYLGYLRSQRAGMNGVGRVNRPELIARHGYDTKFAGHAVRLGVQGLELMRHGHINLPMTPDWRGYIQAIRRGEIEHAEVLFITDQLERDLERVRDRHRLYGIPEQPARDKIDRWLIEAYRSTWAA